MYAHADDNTQRISAPRPFMPPIPADAAVAWPAADLRQRLVHWLRMLEPAAAEPEAHAYLPQDAQRLIVMATLAVDATAWVRVSLLSKTWRGWLAGESHHLSATFTN